MNFFFNLLLTHSSIFREYLIETSIFAKENNYLLNLKLNIVSFDVPYPPNYGGVIDVFYKLKALHEIGVKIYLHTFEYGRDEHEELEEYCDKIFYYERNLGFVNQLSLTPFIVKSREDTKLLGNLLNNSFPILFEGLHTTSFLNHHSLIDRTKIVRTHNVEHDYYSNLANVENNILKKIFFSIESFKLNMYENILNTADVILPLGFDDSKYFLDKYDSNVNYIPVFSSNDIMSINSRDTKEKYILFHGDLSVMDNVMSVKKLMNFVFSKIKYKVVIAGKNPTKEILDFNCDRINVVKNPSVQAMDELINGSSITILYSNQSTGVKLKLLETLLKGQVIVCNDNIVANTDLGNFCIVENDLSKYVDIITKNIEVKVDISIMQKRNEFLLENYNNKKSAYEIVDIIQQISLQK